MTHHVQRGLRKVACCLAIGIFAYPACVVAAPNTGAIAGATAPVHAAAVMPLAAHRAVYDVTLLKATDLVVVVVLDRPLLVPGRS